MLAGLRFLFRFRFGFMFRRGVGGADGGIPGAIREVVPNHSATGTKGMRGKCHSVAGRPKGRPLQDGGIMHGQFRQENE